LTPRRPQGDRFCGGKRVRAIGALLLDDSARNASSGSMTDLLAFNGNLESLRLEKAYALFSSSEHGRFTVKSINLEEPAKSWCG